MHYLANRWRFRTIKCLCLDEYKMESALHGTSRLQTSVTDEPLIRLNAVDFVEDAEFRAIEASSADEALLQLDQNDDISIL